MLLVRYGLAYLVLACPCAALAQDEKVATEKTEKPASNGFASATIDIGMVVSDLDRSVKWYTEVLGLKELTAFQVSGEFGASIGLTNKLPLAVRVFAVSEEKTATKLKLMQFKQAPGARVDQTYLHSTYGFRYVTLIVEDIDASLKRAADKGAKPIADGVVPLPEGFPEGVFIAVLRDPDGNFVELVGPKGQK